MDTKSKRSGIRRALNIISSVGAVLSALVFVYATSAMILFRYLEYMTEYDEKAARYESMCWVVLVALAAAGLAFTVLMTVTSGCKDEDGVIRMNRFDRLPTDIHVLGLGGLLFAVALTDVLAISVVNTSPPIRDLMYEIFGLSNAMIGLYYLDFFEPVWFKNLSVTLLIALILVLCVIFYRSLVIKLKTGTFLRHTIIGRIAVYLYEEGKASRKVFWKAMALSVGACILSATGIGIVPVLALIFIFVPKWVNKYIAVREGIEEIGGGNTGYKIEVTDNGELDRLAEQVNRISDSVSIAIREELKSRQMRIDLISNVSHDLRTPLTSMVTYVDLLKKEGLNSENAEEYLRVIDEKTGRLQKLTEDLFDAAKASSGAIPVNMEKIDMIYMVNQALAEVEEKLDAAGLQVVFDHKPEDGEVYADGQLLWRVIENLLTNAAKYALSGTRVYIDISREGDEVGLEIKNISKEPLNISEDRLMERFTRGDESRNTEGSGLGLAIAKDLTRLMGGKFQVHIDGDLFKAVVVLSKTEGKTEG